MTLPTKALLDATFLVVGPFGPTVQRFTGVRQDGRLCFEGWDNEEQDSTIWYPAVEMIRECRLVAHAR